MRRPCDRCGQVYDAKRPTSKWCSASCRANNSTNPVAPVKAAPAGGLSALASTRVVLEAAGRDESYLGSLALVLAARVDDTPGAGAASLSKELRAVMAEALEGVGPADAMDELKRRRDAKRAG